MNHYPLNPHHAKLPMLKRSSVACLALYCCGLAYADNVPDAGTLLRQQQDILAPTAPTADSVQDSSVRALGRSTDATPIQVKTIVFHGNTHVPDEVLAPVAQSYVGRTVTLGELQDLLVIIGETYRRQGYGFAYAYLPKQDVTEGTIRIEIVEGRAGKVDIENHSAVNQNVLDSAIQRFRDNPSNTDELERGMLLLSDTPGVAAVTPKVSRGSVPGTVDVGVTVEPSPWAEGVVLMNNHGSESAGRVQMTGIARLNNPLGVGDRLQLTLSGLPGNLQNDAHTTVGGFNYDLPVIDALRVGVGYSYLDYRLGGVFTGQAQGSASVASVYALYPLIRQRRQNLFISGTYANKVLNDDQFSLNNDRVSNSGTLTLSGNALDNAFGLPAMTQYDLAVTVGELQFHDELMAFYDREGPNTQGRFGKLELGVQHQRQVWRGVTLSAELKGQIAAKNLDSSERFSLAGPNAVRAFSPAFLSVDSGLLARFQLDYQIPTVEGVSVNAFYDMGTGALRYTAQPGDHNNAHIQGAGVGLAYRTGPFNASLTVATRLGGDAPGLDTQDRTMTWVAGAYSF